MYVKRHEQIEIGCGAILNKIYYYKRIGDGGSFGSIFCRRSTKS